MNLILPIVISLVALIPAAAWAQQPAAVPAQQAAAQADKAQPAPGRYLGSIFGWDTTVTVVSIDAEGQIHGSLMSCPNEIRRKYGLPCATVEFNTQRGKDGLPEHIAPRPITNDSSATNDYTRIKACGGDLCVHVSRMIGREDGKGDEKVDFDATLVKQAADAAATTEQPPPLEPPGLPAPGMRAMPGAPPMQAGRPPLGPPGFALPGMRPGVPLTQIGRPPLPTTIPTAPPPQAVAPPLPR